MESYNISLVRKMFCSQNCLKNVVSAEFLNNTVKYAKKNERYNEKYNFFVTVEAM